ncbi:1675_t:CDS:10 [Acaulospora morrowiae]|uniref:1675_t:CDS:1 n=1 Tax=Acaulospora morrowiae TaxID=94023 RepID=A0A9N8VXB8_9GLOM|nr:1675_t:CDS:10 [Acaulospora morrowiae]
MVRLAVYGGVSTFLSLSIVAAAFRQRSNFYAACIYLSKSSACMMILMNMGFFLTIIFGQLLQTIFFGRLRAVEIEHLYERSWYAVTETCLAMTIFRDEFDTRFVVTFTTLLFLKIFHWLCQDRVEFMEQSPAVPISFHVRMVSLMEILCVVDAILVHNAVDSIMKVGPNMMIMFAFEYSILGATIISTISKYILNIIDMRREEPWENKSIYVFYLELVTDFFKLITYLIFFAIILMYYGIPLHIIRDVYVTLRSFLQKCGDLVRYRRATRNMNERYPNATNEELERLSDRTCIICREEMIAANINNNDNIVLEDIAGVGWRDNRAALRVEDPSCQNVSFIANPIPGFPAVTIFPPPGMQGPWPVPPNPHANLNERNVEDQANPLANQNTQQSTHQDSSQNNSGDRTSNEDEAANASHSQPPTNSSSSTLPRWPWDQNNTASRIFSSVQQSIGHQPHISQFPGHVPPGLIPLFPILPMRSNGNTNAGGNATSSSLSNLSEEQIRLLETTSREALSERIRILQDTQGQIYNIISTLTQTLSVLPQIPAAEIPAVSTDANASTSNVDVGIESVNNINSSENSLNNQKTDDAKNKKGKGKSVTVTEVDESFDRWEQTNDSLE